MPQGFADIADWGAKATIVAAVVAAVAAFVNGLVRAWADTWIAKTEALRTYRLQMIAKSLSDLEVVLSLNDGSSDFARLIEHYSSRPAPPSRKIYLTPSGELAKCAADFALWENQVSALVRDRRWQAVTSEDRDWLAARLLRSGLVFRQALENFAFGSRFRPDIAWGFRTERREASQRWLQILRSNPPDLPPAASLPSKSAT